MSPRRTHRLLSVGLLVPSIVLGALGAGPTVGSAEAAAGTGRAVADDAGHTVTFTAGSGRENTVTITESHTPEASSGLELWHYRIDDRYPITAGQGCHRPDGRDTTVVVCDLHEFGDFTPHMLVNLGDRNDQARLAAGDDNIVHGGSGDDRLDGTAEEMLYGDSGNDVLVGGQFASGGPGDDVLYVERYSGYGDDGNDILIGGNSSETLYGGRGNDTLYGRNGNDTLFGNSGNDLLRGGSGRDKLSGGPGRDELRQ